MVQDMHPPQKSERVIVERLKLRDEETGRRDHLQWHDPLLSITTLLIGTKVIQGGGGTDGRKDR
jgi:hypothetical protein